MKITLQYIAGFFDGEGGVYITQRTDKRCNKLVRSIRCQFTNTDYKVLEKIKSLFGGTILNKNREDGWTPCYWLEIGKQELILNLLLKMEPYLLVKKEQAKIAIKYIKSRIKHQHKNYTKDEIFLADKLRKLTKRHYRIK